MDENISTISPARPERISLDFERLRAEGIRRLEDWAPFIWTDFNVHDPGITILETLCYAITDLAYRTNLPFEDLLASGVNGKNTKSFFKAEEILPVSPVTETDYRKIIIDIPGVKNAWFEKAEGIFPKVCIQKKLNHRPITPNLLSRFEKLFDATKLPKDLTTFEKSLISIGNAESVTEYQKDQLRNKYEKFTDNTTNFTAEDIVFIRETAEVQQDYIQSENLQLIADRLELFMSFFRCTEKYYHLQFKSLNDDRIDAFKTLINKLSSDQIKKELIKIINKLGRKSNTPFNMDDLVQLWNHVDYLALNTPNDAFIVFDLASEIICQSGYYELIQLDKGEDSPYGYEVMQYNGLYKIKIDLHNPEIKPGTKKAKKIIDTVFNKLHHHRNLCEDFTEVSLVETQYLCLCLDLEVVAEADENEVMAKVIFQLQEFLTPTIRFQTTQQMLEKGYTGDQLFNGPLLNHGFITDEELDQGKIVEKIFISDLYNIIMRFPEVSAIHELTIKKTGEKEFISDLTCLDLEGKKPVIDICCSCLFASRENSTIRILAEDINDLIELQQLESQNLAHEVQQKLPVPTGIPREDLAEFTSVQVEFPQNYHIGVNGPPPEASPERLAQIKQLQGYLTFYDRLMGNYLHQLSSIKDLLAVEQDPDMPTYFYDSLYHVPGIKELIFQPVSFGEAQWKDLKKKLEPDVFSLLKSADLKQTYLSFGEWNQAMDKALGHYWSEDKNTRTIIFEIVQQNNSDHWQGFIVNEKNFYIQQLQEIIEPKYKNQERKNQILNHLLARFAEKFTDFSLQQFGVSQEVAVFEDYHDYLRAKASFLKNIPVTSSQRAKAYNYRLYQHTTKNEKLPVKSAVWNTDNVAGIKKKIYDLLNMDKATTESVFCDPVYRFDLDEDESANRPRYFINMVELDEKNQVKRVLLTSTRPYSRNQARVKQQQLNENIRQDWIKLVGSQEDDSCFRVQFSFEDDSDTLVLRSEELNRKQAENLKDHLVTLTDPGACNKESFHLIEHILLRPLVKDDTLLQHSFTCNLQMEPMDPYSFWLTLVLPGWTKRFQDHNYRQYFEQLARRETPAHIAICFRWLEEEDQILMRRLEDALEQWREAKADCEPDACDVSDQADKLLDILNAIPCSCFCDKKKDQDKYCECEDEPGANIQ